jgi:hypothetical protein
MLSSLKVRRQEKATIFLFLGAFAKLRKATITLVMFCPAVRPHLTPRLPLDGFSRNLIFEYFPNICRGNSILIEIPQGYRAIYMKTKLQFLVISRLILLRMRNASDKIYRENQNTVHLK